MSKAIIYTKNPCPYCDRAKLVFKHKGVEYQEISAVDHMDQMVREVTEASGNRPQTVPQIFLDGQYIGGFTQLVEHYKSQP